MSDLSPNIRAPLSSFLFGTSLYVNPYDISSVDAVFDRIHLSTIENSLELISLITPYSSFVNNIFLLLLLLLIQINDTCLKRSTVQLLP